MPVGGKELHRYQIIRVIRDGKVFEHERDMGPVKFYQGIKEFIIPGGQVLKSGRLDCWEFVERAKWWADELRTRKQPQMQEPDPDWQGELDTIEEQRKDRIKAAHKKPKMKAVSV